MQLVTLIIYRITENDKSGKHMNLSLRKMFVDFELETKNFNSCWSARKK